MIGSSPPGRAGSVLVPHGSSSNGRSLSRASLLIIHSLARYPVVCGNTAEQDLGLFAMKRGMLPTPTLTEPRLSAYHPNI